MEAIDELNNYKKGIFFAFVSGTLKRHITPYHVELWREELDRIKKRK